MVSKSRAGRSKPIAPQQAEIVIRAVEERVTCRRERSKSGSSGEPGERIDEVIAPGDAELDEAELLEVRVQAVRLGIDARCGASAGRSGERGVVSSIGCARSAAG